MNRHRINIITKFISNGGKLRAFDFTTSDVSELLHLISSYNDDVEVAPEEVKLPIVYEDGVFTLLCIDDCFNLDCEKKVFNEGPGRKYCHRCREENRMKLAVS